MKRSCSIVVALGLLAGVAHATNGILIPGYGVKAIGMGGVSIALPQDAVVAANNPAGMVLVGNRWDIGADLAFAKIGARVFGADVSDNPFAVVPELGYNRMIGGDLSLGVSVFGSGFAYDYGTPILAPTNSDSSVDLKQVVMAPTVAVKLGGRHAVGASLSVAYQRLTITGLEFPSGVPNPGRDDSWGAGFQLGWIGQVLPNVSVGVTYASKIKMGKLDRYKNLVPNAGDLDIPERYGVGIAIKPTEKLTLAGDYLRINWHDVRALGNTLNFASPLGAPDGSGFGWNNQNVVRIGAAYAVNNAWEVRAGYSQSSTLVPSDQTFFNAIAPLISRKHLSVGSTWKFGQGSELTIAYMHSFKEEIKGTGPSTGVDLRNKIDWLAIAYGSRF